MKDLEITIPKTDTPVGPLTVLTVGRLQDALEGVDRSLPVALANDGWYSNVGSIILPGWGDEMEFHAVTLFPGDGLDPRQF